MKKTIIFSLLFSTFVISIRAMDTECMTKLVQEGDFGALSNIFSTLDQEMQAEWTEWCKTEYEKSAMKVENIASILQQQKNKEKSILSKLFYGCVGSFSAASLLGFYGMGSLIFNTLTLEEKRFVMGGIVAGLHISTACFIQHTNISASLKEKTRELKRELQEVEKYTQNMGIIERITPILQKNFQPSSQKKLKNIINIAQ